MDEEKTTFPLIGLENENARDAHSGLGTRKLDKSRDVGAGAGSGIASSLENLSERVIPPVELSQPTVIEEEDMSSPVPMAAH